MEKIICKINLGSLKQTLIVTDETEKNPIIKKFFLTMEEIPTFIARQNNIKNIYISGATKEFLKKIEIDTKKAEYNLYSQSTKQFHYI